MAKQTEVIVKEGEVLEFLPNTMFNVKLDDGTEVLCTLSGRIRRSYVRVMPGDRVKIEMSPHDEKRGRISYKFNKKDRKRG